MSAWIGPSRTGALVLAVACVLFCSGCEEILSQLERELEGASDSSTPADGLREALRVGTGRAVELLGQEGGYLDSDDVRIPLPDKLEKIGKALTVIGAGDEVDAFVVSMNRAAEAAAPVAREVFVDSIREMTFDDAVAILRGKDHEATDYFREHAGPRLAELFLPIVEDKLAEVGATRSFNELMDETAQLPFLSRPAFDLDAYVTQEALDGLFRRIAEEEEKIRTDPLARTTELLRKYFSD
jgi:hypothetical protein